jgi:hypothetical protein
MLNQRRTEASKRVRRGTAKPRWGWSGVALLTRPQLSASDIDLASLLPGHQSSEAQIVLRLCDLEARYRRYLHQDEFGPTRAERMAALRSLLEQFDLLTSRLLELPGDLQVQLSHHLARCAYSDERVPDNFQAYRGDVAVVQQIAEAAVGVERILHAAPIRCDWELTARLSDAAQATAELLSALDTTTAGTIAIDCPTLEIDVDIDIDIDVIGFATVTARIERLRYRVGLALTRLEQRHGPERCESLRWLVWQLCDLYHRETGRRVTNSAVRASHCNASGTNYTAKPESPAGHFVLAAVEILQPSEAWAKEPDHWGAQRRAGILNRGGLERAVYFVLREYVAHHPYSGRRRRRTPVK